MKALKTIKDLFFPSGIKCIFCDDEIEKENRYCVCGNCSPAFNVQYCLNCGKAIANQAVYCDDCMNGKRYAFTQARAPFVYYGKVRGVVKRLKYGGGKFLAPYMAEYMADSFFTAGWKVDVVTFVPMNVKRKKVRGYNQAEIIAKCLSEKTGVSLVSDALFRVKKTTAQKKLDRQERMGNLRDAFALSERWKPVANVLLIDDIYTTGATVEQAAKILKKAGAQNVYFLTISIGQGI